ncbi:MAG: DUF2085 domain-containing protein [Chloroflexi bacterium]|nr:DUF2085 domain-containing protein [Chloroflexota bacterium]
MNDLSLGVSVDKRSDHLYGLADISPARLAVDRALLAMVGTTTRWLLRHWLLVANLSNAATVFGALLSPTFMALGLLSVGRGLFVAYRLICVQNPTHSYFLFGYQMAMDQRMVAIYGASTIAGLAYAPLRRRLPTLPWRWYLVLIAPMALDGFTQLFGWRISNWELRTATGALFGIATVWWLYPWFQYQFSRLSAEFFAKDASQSMGSEEQ